MAPALLPGDRLLVVRVRPRVGDVVALRDPRAPERLIVKRVAAIDEAITVLGDNLGASTDSRAFGPVPPDAIVGRAVYRYAPTARAGRLSRDTGK